MDLSQAAGSSGSFGLTQQGSVDWVSLGKTTFSASISVFGRLAAANVDPQTLAVAHNIAGRFRLSALGHQRVDDAMSKLKWCSGFGNVVYFGFGIEHPVRFLARTANGYACIALLGALCELSLDVEAGAMIMAELTDVLDAPQDLRPSLRQWRAMINMCNGTLARSTFGCILGHFVRLYGDDVEDVSRSSWSQQNERRVIAEGLDALAKVSRGDLVSIDIAGNLSCAWLAAFGYYFLGFDIEIRNQAGDILYRSTTEENSVHCCVTYEARRGTDSVVTARSYTVPAADDLISTRHHLSLGKLEWADVLGIGFGTLGEKIREQIDDFECMFAALARLFTSMATADPRLRAALVTAQSSTLSKLAKGDEDRFKQEPGNLERVLSGAMKRWVGYHTDSHGSGLLRYAARLFPDIISSDTSWKVREDTPVPEALDCFDQARNRLCKCKQPCIRKKDDARCPAKHAEVFAMLIWTLSLLDFDREARLCQSGIDKFYRRVTQSIGHVNWYSGSDSIDGDKFPRALFLLAVGDIHFLSFAAEVLFTGSDSTVGWFMGAGGEMMDYETTAMYSTGGVSFFPSYLVELDTIPQSTKWIRVIPGIIQSSSGAQYQRVRDAKDFNWTFPQAQVEKVKALDAVPSQVISGIRRDLVIKETLEELFVGFRFSTPNGSLWGMGPARLTTLIIEATGTVSCRRSAPCSDEAPELDQVLIAKGEGSVDEAVSSAAKTVVIRHVPGSFSSRLLPLFVSSYRPGDRFSVAPCILRSDECVSCCVRNALSRVEPLVSIIM